MGNEKPSNEKSGEISAGDTTFRYSDSGSGNGGDPVLWLGKAAASPALRMQIAARHRLVTLDAAAPAASPAARAGAIATAAAELGLSRFRLVAEGNDAGAALELTLSEPPCVAALGLLAPTLIDAKGQAGTADATDLLPRLGAITTPVLALFGTRDKQVPLEAARHYRGSIPTSIIVFVYDGGHALGADRPEAVAELLLDFFARGERFLVRQTDDRLFP